MQGDVFGVVVPRNTPIPTNKSRTFTTVEDNQTTVTFPVYEGERVTCKENRLLGEFEVSEITTLIEELDFDLLTHDFLSSSSFY